ncbi:MAG: DMT family transporter [Clostridia bacterium]|nr:DMT family transporter [Clostridia bacterium]MEE1023480.1 DMT family transporter [Acutalibacteraceae bacterium]
MKGQLKGTLILLLTALIWGCAFVAQSSAADTLQPFTVQATRSIIGGMALIPVILAMRLFNKKKSDKNPPKTNNKMLILGGIVCGVVLCTATNLQQFGIEYTTPGKAGFITALYILFVPLIGLVFKKRVPWHIWICIAVGLVGLYLLCMDGSFSLAIGDTYVLVCAIVFAIHIIAVDYFIQYADGVKLSCIQFFTSGIISLVLMFAFETPDVSTILDAAIPILYLGIMSTGVAYTLQVVGQKYCSPTVASLAMSFESVFAVLGEFTVFGLIMQKDVSMSARELIGCLVMFAAIIISQLPLDKKIKS